MTSTRPVLKLVPREIRQERHDATLAAVAADPTLLAFYTRVLPDGFAPVACRPFWSCA
jgi:hypothetical protein